jgi:hypothetical protein
LREKWSGSRKISINITQQEEEISARIRDRERATRGRSAALVQRMPVTGSTGSP